MKDEHAADLAGRGQPGGRSAHRRALKKANILNELVVAPNGQEAWTTSSPRDRMWGGIRAPGPWWCSST